MNAPAALTARDVMKRYGRGPLALEAIDLSIAAGTITGMVGPNGAGKSTMIKAWVGFERPNRGQVTVGGVDPWKRRDTALRLIGYVPQTPSLYGDLTVADHLAVAATARRNFDRPLARARLDELGISLTAPARSLSGGQAAQVSLALALGLRAPIMLLDEPLANLDPLARREFLRVLTDEVRKNGTTALLTSHVVTDIAQACDHLIVLGGGHKLLDEDIAGALTHHRLVDGSWPPPDAPAVATVASFRDAAGSLVTLLPGGTAGRAATLEELVIGYLAAARSGVAPLAGERVTSANLPERIITGPYGVPIVASSGLSVLAVLSELAYVAGADGTIIVRHPRFDPEVVRACLAHVAAMTRSDS